LPRFRDDVLAQRLCGDDAAARQVDDTGGDDLAVANLTVDVESLESFRYLNNFSRAMNAKNA